MKTTIYTLALAAVAAVMSSCGMSATVYNDTIVAMHDRTSEALSEKVDAILDFENTSKEEAQIQLDELMAMYNEDIETLNGMKYPKAAAGMHKAMTDFVVYIRDNVLSQLGQMLKCEPESDEWYEALEQTNDNVNTANDLEDVMIEEQAKFAAEMDMELR